MIRVRINGEERNASEARESWLNRQVNGRRNSGENLCVQVIIEKDGRTLVLATPGCGGGGGPGRPPDPSQEEFIQLWRKLVLDHPQFTGGHINAFLKQARRICP